MLTLHDREGRTPSAAGDLPEDVTWIDLYDPSRDEELRLEAHLGVMIPTQADMAEIETSSRLYVENGAAYLTAQVAFFGGHAHLQSGPVTFVLVGRRLVTVRYIRPASFDLFCGHVEKQPVLCVDGPTAFLNLVDVIIDRTADLIEKTGAATDELSRLIFSARPERKLEDLLIRLGGAQNDIAKIRDSLVSLARLTAFASVGEAANLLPGAEAHDRLRIMGHDIASLSDHVTYVTGNIQFLLDAALGLINVEQNTVMKVISVTSVIFLPLTLIASIYGMNFVYMPFLHNPYAFWGICAVMLAIIASLLWWFRVKRWL